MWGPWASFGRQLAGKGLPQHCLTSRLFESIVGKSTAVCDWALGKGTEWPGELTEALWDLFDFLMWWWCVLGHAAAVFGKIGEGVSNLSKERLYRCGESGHLVECLCV